MSRKDFFCLTPKAFNAAIEDWQKDREMMRMSQYYSLPAEVLANVKSPRDLYLFSWEEEEIISSEDFNWERYEKIIMN